MRPRRYFKNTEIKMMRDLAAGRKSQAYAAALLGRDPGVVAQAAIRYGIQFNAPPGTSVRVTLEHKRRLKAANNARQRRKRGARIMPQMARRQVPVVRFDDPRVMISGRRSQ